MTSKRESDVLRAAGGPAVPPSIFVAYRMRIGKSKEFRDNFERMVHRHPSLHRFKITDGHVPAGVNWANVIRGRISAAKVVVGDVTGMSPEVMFELGLAYGLRKVRVPAVASPDDVSALPSWIGATQLGNYSDRAGLSGLLSSIFTLLSDPEFAPVPPPPQPIPALAVWLRKLEWNQHALDQFLATTAREGLTAEVLTDSMPDEAVIRRAVSASLLVASLDGTQADALVHFICGAAAARPYAGYGKRLLRSILVVEEPNTGGRTFVAESLRRCQETAQVITLDEVKGQTESFGKLHANWLSPAKRRKKR